MTTKPCRARLADSSRGTSGLPPVTPPPCDSRTTGNGPAAIAASRVAGILEGVRFPRHLLGIRGIPYQHVEWRVGGHGDACGPRMERVRPTQGVRYGSNAKHDDGEPKRAHAGFPGDISVLKPSGQDASRNGIRCDRNNSAQARQE